MSIPGTPQPFDPRALTVRELLAAYVSVLDELTTRGFIRTRNSPLGDLAETIAVRAYGGTLAPNSEKSFDLLAADGRRIQVKARLVDSDDKRSHAFSPFRTWGFDAAVFLVFDSRSYDLRWAREVAVADAQALGRRIEHINGSSISVRQAAGVDVTPLLAAAYARIDEPAA
ncbi:hypothetical protein AB1K56_14675 [Microbacterium sp. BWR-S6Y]|uniref:DUF6998 domain-containing protein n=1 Tax=Microbacterium sp. BWR-S6Y TaxID=3232073 RepID=UPI0035292DA9